MSFPGAIIEGGGVTDAFVQGGNSFGATAVLGTNDAFALEIETGGTTRFTVAAGSATLTGAAGGSTFVGGSGAGDDLTIRATQSGTDGDIIAQSDATTQVWRTLSTGEFIHGIATTLSGYWGEFILIRKDQNAGTSVVINNSTAGTAAYSELTVAQDVLAAEAGQVRYTVRALSASFTPSGQALAGEVQHIYSGTALTGVAYRVFTSDYQRWLVGDVEFMRLLSSGVLTVGTTFTAVFAGSDIATFQDSGNTDRDIIVKNTTSGTAARTQVIVLNTGNNGPMLEATSAAWTPTGARIANAAYVRPTGTPAEFGFGVTTNITISVFQSDIQRSLWNSSGLSMISTRFREAQGADVASANDLTLGTDGNTFEITGVTQINAITIADWQNGSAVKLLFTSTPTVKHNTAGGAGTVPILLAGAVDFVASAGDTLTLLLSEIGGVQAWRETGRAVI